MAWLAGQAARCYLQRLLQVVRVPRAGVAQQVLEMAVAYTKERDTYMDFAVTHLVMNGVAFVRRDSPAVREPADLAGLRVALQVDSYTHEYLRSRGWDRHPVWVGSFREGMLALEAGKCDVVAAVDIVGEHLIRQERLRQVVSSGVLLPGYTYEIHMAVRAGDSLRARAECLAKRPSDSKPDRGVVEMRYTLINQNDAVVFTCRSINLVQRRPASASCSTPSSAASCWWTNELSRRLRMKRLAGNAVCLPVISSSKTTPMPALPARPPPRGGQWSGFTAAHAPSCAAHRRARRPSGSCSPASARWALGWKRPTR